MKEFKFDEKKHIYTLDGKRLYGVTTVLGVIAKPALIQWAANMAVEYVAEHLPSAIGNREDLTAVLKEARVAHRKKKEGAADIGTIIHKVIENWVSKSEEPIKGYDKLTEDEERIVGTAVQNFKDWVWKNEAKILSSEKRLYSEELWVAGTADLVLEIKGKTYIGDIKTTSGIYDKTPFFQCAGYRKMCEDMDGTKFDGSVIIRLDKKTGELEEKYSYDYEGDLKGFLACLTLFKVLEN